MAGWAAKQWPLEYYSELGRLLVNETGCKLVLNAPSPIDMRHTHAHVSGLPGLIDATRRAAAVVGVDSGPLHLAAALGKPGVAIFGPTDPARNGPRGGAITVLRSPLALTTYKRNHTGGAMRDIRPEAVLEVLQSVLAGASARASGQA
jgi:heptosyltransferase-1